MQSLHTLSVAALVAVAIGGESYAVENASEGFHGRIVLIGASKADDPQTHLIQTIAPDGSDVHTLHRVGKRSISTGRFSPDGSELAYSSEGKIWLLHLPGQARMLTDNGGLITAWSPDGKKLAFFRSNSETDNESYVIDTATGQQTRVPLSTDHVAEDWHPEKQIRTLVYMNPGKWIFRNNGMDQYPVRQLFLLTADGKMVPLTEDASFDNIWSRFSPTGDHIVHYRRRFVEGRPHEYAVVCAADGSQVREVLGFTDTGDAAGLPWFRPHGFPAWSPDGKTIAWLVHTNNEGVLPLELVFISADGASFRRMSLTEKGYAWVSAIDWR